MQSSSFIKNSWLGFQKKIKTIFNNPYRQVNLNWFKLKYYKHLPPGKLRKHNLNGKYIYFCSAKELLHGLKEIFIEKIYQQPLQQQPYIIDCGANIGLSVIYMKEQYPEATIIAFEPDEKNFDLLTKNITSFGFTNVTAKKEAVWIENTMLNFSAEASMSSKIETTSSTQTNKVKATRLKEQIDRKVDFLKIDIEGAEYAVLCDLEEKLDMVNNMFIEYHGQFNQHYELTKLFTIISSSGFQYYIKEAAAVYQSPFTKKKGPKITYDIQLNIFCFRP